MGARGRGALAVVRGPFEVIERPAPPDTLTEEQAIEWHKVVNALPAKWFSRETWPMLEQYCRHTIRARAVAKRIDDMDAGRVPMDKKEYNFLLKDEHQQSRTLSSLATKMRLSQQSSYDSTKKRTINQISATDDPWNFGNEEKDSE